ncbi:MAG: 50S ribosomal protein L1 [Nanoarchaeota archaeon]|nr:50S ribosomal protein L1 [Nanoarchaeota archaeon]
MDDKTIKASLDKLKESSKRNFSQTLDLIINLKDLDLKKPTDQVDYFLALHKDKGKKTKVCAFVGPELQDQAEKIFDTTVNVNDFPDYQKKKPLVRKLANDHDFFIAQATIMPKVAQVFGRTLGPRGKMPNPKAGCVVPPNANLSPLYEKLQKTLHISAKKQLVIHTFVGKEDTDEAVVIDNVKTIYASLLQHLPGGKNNLKSIFIKNTMGKPIKLM